MLGVTKTLFSAKNLINEATIVDLIQKIEIELSLKLSIVHDSVY